MRTEFDFKGKHFIVNEPKNRTGKHGSIRSDNFIATFRQIELMSLRVRGLSDREIALQLGISRHTVEVMFSDLIRRNQELTCTYRSAVEICVRAERYELLFPITVMGLFKLYK